MYCDFNNIPISKDIKKNFIEKYVKPNDKQSKMRKSKFISVIPEVDESKYNSPKSSPRSKSFSIQKSKKDSKKSIKNFKKSNFYKKNKISIGEKNNKIYNNDNNISNINSFLDGNFNKITNDKNEDTEIDNFEKINEELTCNEGLEKNIINLNIKMNNYDRNNNFYLTIDKKEKDEELICKNNTYDKIEKLLKDDITPVNFEKVTTDTILDNADKENKKINIYNNIVIHNSNKSDSNFNKINRFNYLENIHLESFKIDSVYENINKISKYNYAIDPSLRTKIKNILLSTESNKKIQSSLNIKRIEIKEEPSFIKNNNFQLFQKRGNESGDLSTKSANNSRRRFSVCGTSLFETAFRKNINKKNLAASNIIDSENTFYKRIKEINQSRINTPKLNNKNKELNRYEEQIFKNIENNTQNLNNPEEYFSGFFTNILKKQQLNSNYDI